MLFSRPTWEGGQYDGDEQSRLAALRLAMELGADHIDVELKVLLNKNRFLCVMGLSKVLLLVFLHSKFLLYYET